MTFYNPDEYDPLLADTDFEDAEARLAAISLDLDGLHEVERSKAIERHLLRMGKTVKALTADETTLQTHATETSLRLGAVTNRLASLKRWMQNLYEQGGLEGSIKDPLVTVYLQKSNPSVEVLNEAEVPGKYKKVGVTLSWAQARELLPDDVMRTATVTVVKQAILDDVKLTKESVDGVEVHNSNKHLRVR